MIIRIFGEGQYELPEPALARLHELDADTESAVSAGDSDRFHDAYDRLPSTSATKARGSPLTISDRLIYFCHLPTAASPRPPGSCRHSSCFPDRSLDTRRSSTWRATALERRRSEPTATGRRGGPAGWRFPLTDAASPDLGAERARLQPWV